MTNPVARIVLRSSIILCFIFSILVSSCKEEEVSGKYEYILRNDGEVPVAFVSYWKGTSDVMGTGTVDPGQERVIVRSKTRDNPTDAAERIEIWSGTGDEKYRDLDLSVFVTDGDRFIWTLQMPHPNGREIIGHNTDVLVYLDETSIYGFYPKVNYPRSTNFFRTSDYFKSITEKETPSTTPNATVNLVDVFHNTIIASCVDNFAEEIKLVKSVNGGQSWQHLITFPDATDRGAYMATDFINEDEGWMIYYTMVFHGQNAETYASDVYKYSSGGLSKVARVDDYCINAFTFADANNGFALASAPSNTMPGGPGTYFLRTTDGGVNWTTPVTISETQNASSIFRLDNGKLIVFFMPFDAPMLNHYYVSSDNGETWQQEHVPASLGIRDLFFLPDGTGFIKTGTTTSWTDPNVGEIWKTNDSGATWTKLKSEIYGSRVWFLNEQHGYTQDLINGKGQILNVTRDGGATWREVLYPYDYLIE